jgi:signal transduction histidine kinase
MRERASIVGGTLRVTSRPGGGTQISTSIPLGEETPVTAHG